MAKVAFTASRIAQFRCPDSKEQAFLWDSIARGLGVRATRNVEAKAFVFQSEFQGHTLRTTIGSLQAWSIVQAQEKARELQRQLDQGRDPRQLKAESTAADVAKRNAAKHDGLTVGEVWKVYLAERKARWSDRHYSDHVAKAQAGGVKVVRGSGITVAGPLYSLMKLRLRDLDSCTIEAWAKKEGAIRPTSARLAWRLLKSFLTWCGEQPAYIPLLPAKNPAKTKKSREALGHAAAKQDVLQREQLPSWFKAIRSIGNPEQAAYMQAMLLTGARPNELLSLKWADINTTWKSVVIRDKVDGQRMIPLTPYVDRLLENLPRRNGWVFSSPIVKEQCMASPRRAHTLACMSAGIEGLTLHGLRRSFSSLTEWLEIPAGVVAQLQGHKPSATAERHYKVRPLDLLRVHHEKIEAWALEQAGIEFEASSRGLRVVGASAMHRLTPV